MGVREEKRARTRAEILSTTVGLFRERGFAATRVADVIERVGISEKTFFNYFPSKEAVLEAKAHETADLYVALLRNLLARPDEPVRTRLEELARALAGAFSGDREWMTLLITHTNLFFGAQGEQRQRDRAAQELLAELFRSGQKSKEIRADVDARQLAELYSAAFLLTTVNWLTGWWDDEEPLEERLPRAIGVLLDGCS
jgi:AcrR family transcriptional regulator